MEELAYSAQNEYNSFTCHKTMIHGEENDEGESFMQHTHKSKECAGFVTLQICEGMNIPEGFTPAYEIIYDSAWDMSNAYEEHDMEDAGDDEDSDIEDDD